MADLVRERAHVVHLVGEVQHDVRQRVLGDRGAEGAAALALARLRVDAVVAVETAGDIADARGEVVERAFHEGGRVVVGDGARRAERRVLVGERELVEPEQLRLVPEPAVREMVMALHGREQDVDRRARDLVVEVARLARVLVPAHAVEHEAVGDERVVDVREDRRLGLECGEERLVGRQALLAHRPAHACEHFVDRAILAVERDAQRRGDLIEERVPGAGGGGIALGDHLLLGLAARVRREAPRARQVVAVAREEVVGEHALGVRLVDGDPLELEEPQRVHGLGHGDLDRGVEVALGLAVDVDREAQTRDTRRAARAGCRSRRARRVRSRARARRVRRRGRDSARGIRGSRRAARESTARAASSSAKSGARSQWMPALVVVGVWLIARHGSARPRRAAR